MAIEVMNNDDAIDAYIVQYPFPVGLDYERAILEVASRQGRRRPPPRQPRLAGDGP